MPSVGVDEPRSVALAARRTPATVSPLGSYDSTSLVTSAAAAAVAPTATTAAAAGSGASAYMPLIQEAAARYGIDPALLYGVIRQESDFDPTAVSSAGAEGLAQIMPENFTSLGITNPMDPAQSIDGGAQMLAENLRTFGGNTVNALAAYNAGVGAVQQYGGVPPYPETQNYVQQVLGYAGQYPGAEQTSAFAATGAPSAYPTQDATAMATSALGSPTVPSAIAGAATVDPSAVLLAALPNATAEDTT